MPAPVALTHTGVESFQSDTEYRVDKRMGVTRMRPTGFSIALSPYLRRCSLHANIVYKLVAKVHLIGHNCFTCFVQAMGRTQIIPCVHDLKSSFVR